jgi:hypothetical protein
MPIWHLWKFTWQQPHSINSIQYTDCIVLLHLPLAFVMWAIIFLEPWLCHFVINSTPNFYCYKFQLPHSQSEKHYLLNKSEHSETVRDRNTITTQKDNYIHKTTNKKENWWVENTNTHDSTMRNNKNRLEDWQHKTKENKSTYS